MNLKKILYKLIYHKYDRYYFDDQKTSLVSGYRDLFLRGQRFDAICSNPDCISEVCNIVGLRGKQKEYLLPVIQQILRCENEKGKPNFEEAYGSLMDTIQALEPVRHDKEAIKRIVYILLTRGFFRGACLLRKKFEDLLLQYGTLSERFSVYVETGRFEDAGALMERSAQLRIMKMLNLHEYITYYDCLGAFGDGKDRRDNKNDTLFRKSLENRKVYIIGPSNNGEMPPIADEDVLIRYAYFGVKPEKYAYHRINFAYYNGKYGTQMAEKKDLHFLDDLDMCVFKYEDKSGIRAKLYRTQKGRRARWSHRIMFLGSPNMLQLTLTDVLTMGAKDVVVLDNNLYLNNIYDKKYVSSQVVAQMDAYTKMMQFAQHDIIGNFQYVKSLHHCGLFTCDRVLEEIMQMSTMEYAHAMEKANGCLRR